MRQWIQQKQQQFAEDNRGSVAVMFAAMLVPVLLSIGLAVDYSSVSRVREQLQSTADSSAILAVNLANQFNSASEASQHATNFFKGSMSVNASVDVGASSISLKRTAEGWQSSVEYRAKVANAFGNIFGVSASQLVGHAYARTNGKVAVLFMPKEEVRVVETDRKSDR